MKMAVEKGWITPSLPGDGADAGALDALLAGSVDAVLISESTGKDAITTGSPIFGLDPVAFTGYYGLCLSKASSGDAKSLVAKLESL